MARKMSIVGPTGPQDYECFDSEKITPFEEFCHERSWSLILSRDRPKRQSNMKLEEYRTLEKKCDDYGGPWGEFVHKGYIEYPICYRELYNHRHGSFVRVAQKRSGPYPPAAYPKLAERVAAARAATRTDNQHTYERQLSELFQANASASIENIASFLDIKERVFALQRLKKENESEHVVDSEDGRRYKQAWDLWNTPAEYHPQSAIELTANFKYHSKKLDCTCNLNERDSEKDNGSETGSGIREMGGKPVGGSPIFAESLETG